MKLILSAPLAALALTLAACGGQAAPSADAPSGAGASSSKVAVVASTDVYGSIAQAVGGDAVQVTSIIDDPDKDPHEYEADVQNQLALSKAALVLENGGGYDDFVDTMLKASSSKATVINAADVSGYDQNPQDGEFNEHLWYDFPTVTKVVDTLTTDLGQASPADAATFTANAQSFKTRLQGLEAEEAAIKKAHGGEGVAITEPVPLYLLNASGLTNKTPDAFSEAIEEDTDVSPTVLNETLKLFTAKQIKLLAYNEQTTGAQTEAVLKAAQQNAIAVVPVTETLPAGKDYLTWMGDNLQAVSDALGS